jgi:hypothetical protein
MGYHMLYLQNQRQKLSIKHHHCSASEIALQFNKTDQCAYVATKPIFQNTSVTKYIHLGIVEQTH